MSDDKNILTKEQKKKYLDNPDSCPYCESRDITESGTFYKDMYIYQSWDCDVCCKRWEECYELIKVVGSDE
uniref:Uncharacterized protein n=1 Tax=viral metagenome TaxID=1070528 RepID=A0A6H1ZB31_9ZZZZ